MSKFLNLLDGIETVEGEVIDEVSNHVERIVIDGTHAAVGRIVSERIAQKIAHEQRMRDAQSAALIHFAAIRAALKPREPKEEKVSFDMSESSGDSACLSVNHSCTDNGDWGDYGYF